MMRSGSLSCYDDGSWNVHWPGSPGIDGASETTNAYRSHEAMVRWSMIRITSRRLTKPV